MACCFNFFKAVCQSEAGWASQVVKEAVENYSVIMFVDSNNSTCERLKQLLVGEIGVPNVYVVEIDKMNYKPIEKELERLTGCRITPHVFVHGKFIGGEDLLAMHQSDELIPLLLGEKVECKLVKTNSSEHADQDD